MGDIGMEDAGTGPAPKGGSVASTYYAPAERAAPAELRAARTAFLRDGLAAAVIEGLPDPVMVLNRQRQIIAGNNALLELVGLDSWDDVLGLRPGEAAHCIRHAEGPEGCGTGLSCLNCGAVDAVLKSFESHSAVEQECRLQVQRVGGPTALDVLVRANPVILGGLDLAVVVFRDISAEKRRRVLERVFLHDVLNSVSKIGSLAYLLEQADIGAEAGAEYKRYLRQLATEMAEEIHGHRELLAAEQGQLRVRRTDISAVRVLEQVVASYQHCDLARGRALRLGRADRVTLHTDPGLLRRALGNLVKNALEATPEGGVVTVGAETGAREVTFFVHNPGFIAHRIQGQIFQRSFSTKEGDGRGIGTHSVKLLTERYLGGRTAFTSTEADGTRFTIMLPLRP
jgi:signal transduction histidine kinase